MPNVLTFQTYKAKVIGMIAMQCAGMSLGKYGPYVHIAGCIANCLPYKALKYNRK